MSDLTKKLERDRRSSVEGWGDQPKPDKQHPRQVNGKAQTRRAARRGARQKAEEQEKKDGEGA